MDFSIPFLFANYTGWVKFIENIVGNGLARSVFSAGTRSHLRFGWQLELVFCKNNYANLDLQGR